MNKNNTIKYAAIISYVSIFFSIVSGLLLTPWLLRKLGDSDYALFTLARSIIAYFIIDFGIGTTVTRFIAKYKSEGDELGIKKILGITTKIYLILDLIIFFVMLIMYFNIEHIYTKLTPEELKKFKTIFLVIGLMCLASVPFIPLNGVYLAYERLISLKIFTFLEKIITVAFSVLIIYQGKGIIWLIIVTSLVPVITKSTQFFYIKSKENLVFNLKEHDKSILKNIFEYSAWISIAMIADRLFFSIIPTLLATTSNTHQITIFSIAASIEGYVLIFANALSGLFLNRVTNLVNKDNQSKELNDLMIKVGRFQLMIVSTLIIGMLSLGKEFIYYWMGEAYTDSYFVMILILIPCLIHLTQGIGMEVVFATGKVKYRAMVYVFGSLISIVLTLVLSPTMGAIGAGIGIFTGFLISHEILMNYLYKKKFGLNINRFFKECHLSFLPSMLIGLISGFVIQKYIQVSTIYGFLIKTTLWGGLYLLIIYIFVLSNEEKQMMLNLLHKIRLIRIKEKKNK